ncbi:DUF3304 domain-containing protein [Duganella violaceipulchra]|uniref:DUF3304 domain-containing protein n=1 Tax=Duganella violaceipulchra TaxID=2849652 RepID=A0AA41L2B5_9BURK|nr:DUF3304 domain-containing protein [Duganella violaceicalia]MBV6322108.1 DUF3304 domain-containing protein [Duganella violaceicalia]MCP2006893.1 hypothetical protein [Duganella violaceicalia]
MKLINHRVLRGSRTLLAVSLFVLPVIGLCGNGTVPVSIHGVNYSGDDFSYVVEDPQDSTNKGGGESIGPYEAGGTMCCYRLPQTWRRGIQIKVHAVHSARLSPDKAGPEIAETQIVEVPEYIDGKTGELWVIRAADGALSAVSSDFQPNHAKWPGAVKGWPVPSLEYKRQRWGQYMKLAQDGLDTANEALAELKISPQKLVAGSWKLDQKYQPKSVQEFSGPEDERYVEYVRQKFLRMKRNSEEEVRQVQERRP